MRHGLENGRHGFVVCSGCGGSGCGGCFDNGIVAAKVGRDVRFVVDRRSGIVAVRDLTILDPDDQGCGPDKPDVVFYRMGRRIESTREMLGGWEMDDMAVMDAIRVCAHLNAGWKVEGVAIEDVRVP